MKQKKIFILAALFIITFASCKNGKLPWASVQGATVVDWFPIIFILYGITTLLYVGYDQLKNGKAYSDKVANPATKRFIGVSGAIVLVFGIAWILTA